MQFDLGVFSKATPLAAALAAAGLLAIASPAPATAGVMAVSILEVNNFMATDTSGTQLKLGTQISVAGGNNSADTSATLNGVSQVGTASAPLTNTTFGAIDLPQRCVGACPPFAENSYSGVGFASPPAATYAASDMVLTGTTIDTSPLFPNSGGVDAKTRADVAIAGGTNGGSSVTNAGTDVNFSFTALTDLSAQFSLDYIVQLRAFLDTASHETGSAQSSASWSLNLLDLTAGGTQLLNWVPTELNTSRTATIGPADLFVDTSGSLTSDIFTLVAGNTYQLSIRHVSLADAEFVVPEPITLALFGVGLVGLGLIRRQRQ